MVRYRFSFAALFSFTALGVHTWLLAALLLAWIAPGTSAEAGWPFFSDEGPRRGTPEWYEMHADDPVGARQRFAYGKTWPPQARPVGPPQTFIHKYYAAHYWPQPYNFQDREVVRSVMQMQSDNGWQGATTLYDYHFDKQSNQLNSSGQEHLRWLLTHAPSQYRQAYVASGIDPNINSQRVLAVEQEIVAMLGQSPSMPVLLRVGDPSGMPADQVRNIFDQAEASRTPPTIPFSSAMGGAGGQ